MKTKVRSLDTGTVIALVQDGAYVKITTNHEFSGYPRQAIYLEPREALDLAHALMRAALKVTES